LAELPDEELCSRVAARDDRAFEALVERYQARAYRLAYSVLGSEADARDVSQDAFVKLFESAGKFSGRSQFSTWFYRIVVNLCIDHKRHHRWWSKIVPLRSSISEGDEAGVEPVSTEAGPEAEAMRHETSTQLAAAFVLLSPNQRVAVLLQVQDGLSSREIAEVLRCSESTARVHIHRGLAALRKLLKKNE
jgi:RNA polymerase sigma-70 factor (ECF subfamily)